MAIYKDSSGAEHKVRINLITRRKVLDAFKIDFVACATQPEQLLQLLDSLKDGEHLFRVLAVIEGVPADDLLSVADQETEEAAGAAFIEALSDFFHPSNPMKAGLKNLLQRVRTYQATTANPEALQQVINQVDIGSVLSDSTPLTSGSGESPPLSADPTGHS